MYDYEFTYLDHEASLEEAEMMGFDVEYEDYDAFTEMLAEYDY